MNFQKIVLIIAIVLLIACLGVAGVMLAKPESTSTAASAPVVADCPDYWLDLSGNGSACFNIHKLGTCNIPGSSQPQTMDFTVAPYVGSSGLCAKSTWANNCGVAWDNVNSGTTTPCAAGTGATTSTTSSSN